jgi:2-polyprenyl-6-methoxyphenol hydroxylase-like FAD-dependent oxidoreductase
MHHTLALGDVAHECFGWTRTLAILPLPPDARTGEPRCSAVVTTDNADAARLMALDAGAFAAEVQAHFQGRLGPMDLVGERHAYPLVAAWAHRFSGPRFALLGDAAVGMHPVTAHGFNLGLAGVERLTTAITAARSAGRDWGTADALAPYASGLHRHAWPIYQGTNAVVKLFTDARPVPRLLRQAVLQGARRLPPLQAAIAAQLTGRSPWRMLAAGMAPQRP